MKSISTPENSIVFDEFGKVDYIETYQISKSTKDGIEEISN